MFALTLDGRMHPTCSYLINLFLLLLSRQTVTKKGQIGYNVVN
jgi:hypothetical protein